MYLFIYFFGSLVVILPLLRSCKIIILLWEVLKRNGNLQIFDRCLRSSHGTVPFTYTSSTHLGFARTVWMLLMNGTRWNSSYFPLLSLSEAHTGKVDLLWFICKNSLFIYCLTRLLLIDPFSTNSSRASGKINSTTPLFPTTRWVAQWNFHFVITLTVHVLHVYSLHL